uniref:DUF1421 domain-containing protein n=1 Tax=Heligmosomoides polygyrus TaxID=6339 RepID=A0A8L8KFE6_HELPZ
LIAFAQQFSAQRASEGSPDALPAWYQMSTKQQMTPGFGFGRNAPSQYERVPSNGNYHNYPSFGANRPLYPDLMGAAQPARRYPNAGQDPNAELLAAIKDVVAKFKASLDETGLDQDVRLMGNQLRNTWQQLRTGVDRGLQAVKQSAENSIAQSSFGPMNEQLGRLFEKAADDVNQAPNKPLQ